MRRCSLAALAIIVAVGCDKTEPPADMSPAPPTPASASPIPYPQAPSESEAKDEDEDGAKSTDPLAALVAADDRSDDDRQTDVRRLPVAFLRFAGIEPGDAVADIGAGTGYTTELLVRRVGPEGKVYGQNSPVVLERFAEKGWSERLAKPLNQNVVRLDRPFDDPFPADIEPLDAVVNVIFYHDFAWMKVDRAQHNKAVFEALKPGGVYIVIDASGAERTGDSQSDTLHRVEEALVVREVEAAGFELVEQSDAWRNPNDTRDWPAPPWRSGRDELSDKFALKFKKPQ